MAAALTVADIGGITIPANCLVIVEATRQMSAGRTVPPSKEFRRIWQFEPMDEFPYVMTTAYTLKFGPLIAGYRIWMRFSLVSDDGLASAPFTTSFIVQP